MPPLSQHPSAENILRNQINRTINGELERRKLPTSLRKQDIEIVLICFIPAYPNPKCPGDAHVASTNRIKTPAAPSFLSFSR